MQDSRPSPVPQKEFYSIEEVIQELFPEGIEMQDAHGRILDRREMLRVKIKSLMEEARIIRKEEKRARFGQLREELHFHRVHLVRSEARSTHIAYGLIRGLPWERIEVSPQTPPNWKRIHEMLKKYGPIKADWSHIPGCSQPLKKAA